MGTNTPPPPFDFSGPVEVRPRLSTAMTNLNATAVFANANRAAAAAGQTEIAAVLKEHGTQNRSQIYFRAGLAGHCTCLGCARRAPGSPSPGSPVRAGTVSPTG